MRNQPPHMSSNTPDQLATATKSNQESNQPPDMIRTTYPPTTGEHEQRPDQLKTKGTPQPIGTNRRPLIYIYNKV